MNTLSAKLLKIKLRAKFISYIVFIHIIILALSLDLLNQNKIYFVLAELVVIVSILLSIRLYSILVRPVNLISSGVELLKEKDFNTRLVLTGQAEVDSLIEVYNKMSYELREEKLRQIEQNYFLEKLIEASPSGIVVMDKDERADAINPAAKNMLALHKYEGARLKLNEMNSRLAEELNNLMEGEPAVINLSGNQIYKCYKSYFLDQGFKRYFYIIEEMTKEVLKTERKAYEKVIRMMSHEINNSIGAVNSFLHSFSHYKEQLRSEDQEDFANSLKIAIERNTRLNAFISNFAGIVKIPEPEKTIVDLNSLLLDVEKIFSSECERRCIKWRWQLAPSPFKIEIDLLQMEQVIYNIIKNAIESIEREGAITVITESSPQKKLVIRDTGRGIPKDLQPQIFTPFFSTKADGQGIGLTLVKEVLINHNFDFTLETKSEGCTDFQILF